MATISGDVQYSQVMGHLPTPDQDNNFMPSSSLSSSNFLFAIEDIPDALITLW